MTSTGFRPTGIWQIDGMGQPESFSVTHLVATFRQALVALIPSVEAVSIEWDDENRYDDWDQIEEVLFGVLVVGSARGDLARFGSSRPFPRYNFRVTDYGEFSWFEVVVPGTEGRFALDRLGSATAPFSDVQVVRVDQRGSVDARLVVPWSPELQFRAQLRALDGALTPVDFVAPVESVI